MSDAGIRLRGLSKRYPENPLEALRAIFFARGSAKQAKSTKRPALDGIDLDIRAGERIGILAGTIAPSAGQCGITGSVTAILTLGTGLRDELSGRDNIAIGIGLQHAAGAEADCNIAEAIEFTELGDKIDAPVRTYSSGMKARLAFSTLVHGTPEILVVDEALSVGDAFFATKASAKLKELCERGRIAVIVSHSMESLVKLCDRCVWLHEGRVRMDGAPDAVTAAYVNWVHESDERKLLERFRDRRRAEILDPRLVRLEMTVGPEEGAALPILATESALEIRALVGFAQGAGPAHLHLSLSRLDGPVIVEERYPPGEGALLAPGGEKRLVARLASMPLASGVFVAKLKVDSDNAVLGEATAVFEVRAPDEVGGRRLLYTGAAPLVRPLTAGAGA